MNVSEELARLAALRDSGVLTEEEFQAQKAAVLAGGSTPAAAPVAAEPAKKAGAAKKGCAVLAVIILVLIVIGFVAAPNSGTDAGEQAASAPAEPVTEVTSTALAQAYEANEAAAQQTYGNKRLAVTGVVQGVQLGIGDAPSVLLTGTNQFMHVQAALSDASKPKASGLSKGRTVTVTCASVSEIIGTPMLSDCDL